MSRPVSSEDIAAHESLVRRIASFFWLNIPHHTDLELDDLLQAGRIGLWKALQNWEPDRGAKLETYASIRIRGSILDCIRGGTGCKRGGYIEYVHTDRYEQANMSYEHDHALKLDFMNAWFHPRMPIDCKAILIRANLFGETLQQIADDLGVTEGRICQLRTEAVRFLEKHFPYPGVIRGGLTRNTTA